MKKSESYAIEVESGFKEFWRYNIAVTCGMFDADGTQCGFRSAENTVAPAGSNLESAPEGTSVHRRLSFTAGDCHHLLMYVYLIPNTLPPSTRIADCKPFKVTVRVSYEGTEIVHMTPSVNQWSGASIEIRADRP